MAWRKRLASKDISRGPKRCRDGRRSVAGTVKATLAWAKDTGADLAKTNVNGGAIAIGHPLGASGARIMTTMVNASEQRERPVSAADDVRGQRHGQRDHH